jgi:hypothetical protein
MNKFWTLVEQSVILQAVLTLSIWGVVLYLVVSGRPIPDVLLGAANLVLGFYFGSKLAMAKASPTVIIDRRSEE